METVIGVDGCPAGWVCCTLERSGAVSFRLIDRLRAIDSGCDLCCLDMPVGLADRGVRAADMAAKGVLGRWNARVFLAPVREVFAETDYPAANRRSRELSNKGLSKQMWSIMPKIRAVDAELRADPTLRGVVRECHPEICFWGLSGAVIGENKGTPAGFAARVGVLSRFIPDATEQIDRALTASPRGAARADDFVDAMVCAVTAAGVWDASLRTLPEIPGRDGHGLPMEMVYRDGSAVISRVS